MDIVNAGLDIICLTSKNAGTPVSLIEAQAAGIAVVSSDVGGVRDVVSKESGLLFKSDDEQAFIEQMETLIVNPELRLQMGKAGVNWALENFSSRRLANDVKKLYLELLNGA